MAVASTSADNKVPEQPPQNNRWLGQGPTPGLVPVPDPTTLTNALVEAATKSLADRIEARIDGTDKYIDERFKSIVEQITVFKTQVDDRFRMGDVQAEKAARDIKSAVDSAFAASKEAVGEQNRTNEKQIDQINQNMRLSSKNVDDKFSDLKDRVVAIEGRAGGHNDSIAWMIAIVSAVAAVALVIVDLMQHK